MATTQTTGRKMGFPSVRLAISSIHRTEEPFPAGEWHRRRTSSIEVVWNQQAPTSLIDGQHLTRDLAERETARRRHPEAVKYLDDDDDCEDDGSAGVTEVP